DLVHAGMEGGYAGHLECLARAAPVTAARAALGAAVADEHLVADLERGATDLDVEHVLATADAGARAPADVQVFDVERGSFFADQRRRSAVGALADNAGFAVELRGVLHRERRAQRGLDGAFPPVVAQIPGGLVRLRIRVEGVRETEHADTGVEVELP